MMVFDKKTTLWNNDEPARSNSETDALHTSAETKMSGASGADKMISESPTSSDVFGEKSKSSLEDCSTPIKTEHPGLGSSLSTTVPGAFRIQGIESGSGTSDSENDTFSENGSNTFGEATAEPIPETTPVRNLSSSALDISIAYVVEDTAEPEVAEVVKTVCGIERRHFLLILFLVISLIAIITASVVGTVLTRKKTVPIGTPTCGPLCGEASDTVPNPERKVFGITCSDWNTASIALYPDDDDDSEGRFCSDRYSSAAYGCECPNMEAPLDSCGMLCQDSKIGKLPDPDRVVRGIDGIERTCRDWQFMSQFDTTADDSACANYHAIGVLCGCENNEPPPNGCGPLCNEIKEGRTLVDTYAWGQRCSEWDVFSRFSTPTEDETCDDLFGDISYECQCLEAIEFPPNKCGSLCQKRTICGSVCQDDSDVPEPNKIVRGLTCHDWQFFSRLAAHEEMCFFYDMIGAECGCQNTPPSKACGPLCDSGTFDQKKEVRGLSCDEWNSSSMFLFEGYGLAMPHTAAMIQSCDVYFSPISYTCGCSSVAPPEGACGMLCKDGSSVPDPNKIVGDRSCGDFELLSQFETDPDACERYRSIVGIECGCEDQEDVMDEQECYTIEDLEGETFFKTIGLSQYLLILGKDGGEFNQVQNNNAVNLIGRFAGYGTGSDSIEAYYGGGGLCGLYGPRRGMAKIVEDEEVSKPVLNSIIEPYTCFYQAELRVPKLCA